MRVSLGRNFEGWLCMLKVVSDFPDMESSGVVWRYDFLPWSSSRRTVFSLLRSSYATTFHHQGILNGTAFHLKLRVQNTTFLLSKSLQRTDFDLQKSLKVRLQSFSFLSVHPRDLTGPILGSLDWWPPLIPFWPRMTFSPFNLSVWFSLRQALPASTTGSTRSRKNNRNKNQW